jgi:large subunit ribosomal protein L20
MRVKTGIVRHRRHKKILKLTKGSQMGNRKRIRLAKQTVLHAGEYAYAGRKLRKRDFRKLWIQRISAALTDQEISYSKFMGGLKKANISLNRKMLAELALKNPEVFKAVVSKAK